MNKVNEERAKTAESKIIELKTTMQMQVGYSLYIYKFKNVLKLTQYISYICRLEEKISDMEIQDQILRQNSTVKTLSENVSMRKEQVNYIFFVCLKWMF